VDEPLGDLTKAVMRARRGLSADTKLLASLLPDHKLFLPLGKPVPAGSLAVAYHAVPGPQGDKFCPLFTDDRILALVGQRRGWKTEAGPLELAELSGTQALKLALDWAEDGQIRGAVLNPFHAAALELSPDEMRGLLSGDPRALRRHLQALPIQPEEKFITRRPEGGLPKEFVEAIERLVRSTPGLGRFSIIEIVSAERDAPSLLLAIHTTVAVDGPTCAEAVDRAITGKVPPRYSHVDVKFEGAGTKQRPRR
jgi:hypothetical protein